MDRPPQDRLPNDLLPEAIARFVSSTAAAPAKLMAAKGVLPIKGADLLIALYQLALDEDESLAATAQHTLLNLPFPVLLPACTANLPASVLDFLADRFQKHQEALEVLVRNPAIADGTLAFLARSCSESIAELIALNQQRLLGAPVIVEALYKNRNTRMSTVDRLVELCARNGVTLDAIPAFQAHVEAIQGQLIPEPSDEPLPSDQDFAAAMESSAAEPAIDIDAVEGTESLKDKFKPLLFRIRNMSTSEKIRLAVVGDAAARSILVRDPSKTVSQSAITSPSMTDQEAVAIAYSREVGEDILRYIGNRREWLKSYEIKRALTFNPKTPIAISLRFLGHLRANDLKDLSRSRGVSNSLKSAARQRLEKVKT